MERLQRVVLAMVRAGLWERELDDLSAMPLSHDEWEQLYRICRQQTITGIVYQALQYLPDEMMPPCELLLRWTAEADAIERRNKKMNSALHSLVSLLAAHGIKPIVQKGQTVAQYYNIPRLRECGDIDLCFQSKSDMDAANECIKGMGIAISKMPDNSMHYMWQGFGVEHHTHLLDVHNPFLQNYTSTLQRVYGYDEMGISDANGLMVCVPSPVLNLLMLSVHILKHAMGWGIGLRQLCDMARACHHLTHSVDKVAMQQIDSRLGLNKWTRLLHAFLTEHLGLRADELPYHSIAQTTQPLLDIVWQSGNFGCQQHLRTDAGQSLWTRKMRTARNFGSKLPFIFRYAPKEALWMCAGLLKGQL